MNRYWRWAVAQWDRVAGWACVGGGAVLTLFGAINVSRARDQLDQLSYLASGAALGLFLLGVGAILILTADLRDEWGKLDEVASLLRREGEPAPEITLPEAGESSNGRSDAVPLRAGFPAVGVAGIGMLGGAGGVRHSLDQASALRWTQLSGASLILTLVVAGILFVRARREVARGLAEVAAIGAAAGRVVQSAEAGVVDDCYVVDGSRRYHAAGCDLLRFSEARRVPAGEAAAAGFERCPICR